MRILVATPFLPHPRADHGGGVYLGVLLRALARHAHLTVISLCRPQERALAADLAAEGGFELETIAVRRNEELGQLGLLGSRARLLWQWGLAGRPLLAAKLLRREMARALRRRVAAGVDAVLLEFAVMAQYLPVVAGSAAVTVLTDHECGGHSAAPVLGRNLGRGRDARLWRRFVARFYPRADLVQAVNAEDAATLQRQLQRPVAVRPVVVDLPAQGVDVAAAPPAALFLGNYAHAPNVETAQHLARAVWPRVRARVRDARLVLAGAGAAPAVEALGTLPGVEFHGFVPDLAHLFAGARTLLAPVFSGAGSRVKVLSALAHGVAVVANERALRGVGAPTPAAWTADGEEDLADRAAAMLADPTVAAEAGRAARAWATAHVDAEAVARLQIERIEQLRGRAVG